MCYNSIKEIYKKKKKINSTIIDLCMGAINKAETQKSLNKAN